MSNISGVGIDIVEIKRLTSILKKNKSFKSRIFSKTEINFCEKKLNKFNCYSKRFAAKEAFSKAIGTGISKGINFNEITVENNSLGKPNIKLKGKTQSIVKKIIKKRPFNIFLSLSDEKKYAIAIIIISS